MIRGLHEGKCCPCVAEQLLPREMSLLEKMPSIKIWKVYGNYIHRVEMNTTMEPFNNKKVRQALNYLVPRDSILKAIYFNTARPTKSPIAEIYPGYADEFFSYTTDVDKAKALLKEAGFPDGFKTELAYRTGEQVEEEISTSSTRQSFCVADYASCLRSFAGRSYMSFIKFTAQRTYGPVLTLLNLLGND